VIRTFPIVPVPKPRQVRSDKWKKRPCVMRYRAFCDECRARGMHIPESGATITFVLPMPKSWSERKKSRLEGEPHTTKPDLSNILKAAEDALYSDDSAIWHYAGLKKVWGRSGRIIIEVPD